MTMLFFSEVEVSLDKEVRLFIDEFEFSSNYFVEFLNLATILSGEDKLKEKLFNSFRKKVFLFFKENKNNFDKILDLNTLLSVIECLDEEDFAISFLAGILRILGEKDKVLGLLAEFKLNDKDLLIKRLCGEILEEVVK